MLVPATTINLGATQSAVAGTVVNVVNITPSKLVGSVTVAQGLTTSFTLVVSNAGPGTLTGSLNDSIPANFQHHAGAGGQRGQRQRQHRQLQRLGQRRVAGSVTIASGGTVTVTIEVTAISTGTYTNT